MEDMPEWMIAQEILVKSKNEIILEAIDTLHKEIDEKRLEINGHTIKLPDKSSEIDMDMLIINNLLQQEQKIIKQYSSFIKKTENGEELSPEIVERTEELKKFLMSVAEISLLMNFAKTIDAWILDFAETMNKKDVALIISETAKRNVDRIEVLRFMSNNRNFLKSDALTNEEFEIIKDALNKCG